MSASYKLGLGVITGVLLGACYLGSATVGPAPAPVPAPDAGPAGASNLPCDLQTMLAAKCQSCHSSPPVGGAPMSLMTYDDLVAPGHSDASKTEAQLSVERMNGTTSSLMPPGGGATSDEVTMLQNWIAAGPIAGSCSTEVEAGASPYDTPVQCSSHKSDPGNQAYSGMLPGKDCNNSMCHGDVTWNKAFLFSGTVYATAHEPDLCFGVAGGLTVKVTERGGKVISAPVNQYGDFYYYLNAGSYSAPFTAVQVVGANGHRDMSETAPNGQCNDCHTQAGANPFKTFATQAPGRIMAP